MNLDPVLVFALSFVWGVLVALLSRGISGWCIGIGLPTVAAAAYIVYLAYGVPYSGGGASMWPIALVVLSGSAAVCSAAGVGLVYLLRHCLQR
ncbi:hypothetical protein L1281_001528 [Neisseria sp. HSC-16F19]|nr:hypothetical protein [Neisseria sp. HSC-16F19]MCP2040938.1 hypothetical protein [Neisseria sp. HSC-16F19]